MLSPSKMRPLKQLTPDDCRTEIATLLARGLVRLRQKSNNQANHPSFLPKKPLSTCNPSPVERQSG